MKPGERVGLFVVVLTSIAGIGHWAVTLDDWGIYAFGVGVGFLFAEVAKWADAKWAHHA